MGEEAILKCVFIVFVLLIVLCGNIKLLQRFRKSDEVEKSLRRIMKLLVLSGFISDLMNLASLLISTSSGGWPFGFQSCEIVGFFTNVQLAAANWMIALATAERYVILLVHCEFSSIFSARNLQILVTGLYLLVLVTSTGPFYGFGEYTYLRGYLKLLVTANVSYPLESKFQPTRTETESVYQLFNHLRKTAFVNPGQDTLSAIAVHLETGYNVMVKRAKWLPHGILFYIRTLSEESLDKFMAHYHDKTFLHNVTQMTLIDDVASTLHIPETEVTAFVDPESYEPYKNIYLPIQDLGLCSADFTSPNIHSSVWTGFFVLISFVLPYGITLTCLCIIYMRSMRFAYTDKQITETDVQSTNSICTVAVFTCIITLFYDVVILAAGDGVNVSSDLVFWGTFFVSSRSIVMIIVLKLTMCAPSCKFRNVFRMCGIYAKEALSYELSEIEFTRSTSIDETSRASRPYI